MNELDALRSVDFDWAMRLSEVWSDTAWDMPDLHANIRSEFARKLDDMRRNPTGGSPLGWVIVGERRDGEDPPPRRRSAARRPAAIARSSSWT